MDKKNLWLCIASIILANKIYAGALLDQLLPKSCATEFSENYEWLDEDIQIMKCKQNSCTYKIRVSGRRTYICGNDTSYAHADAIKPNSISDIVHDSSYVKIDSANIYLIKNGESIIEFKPGLKYLVSIKKEVLNPLTLIKIKK